jgi:hypothetical protein
MTMYLIARHEGVAGGLGRVSAISRGGSMINLRVKILCLAYLLVLSGCAREGSTPVVKLIFTVRGGG